MLFIVAVSEIREYMKLRAYLCRHNNALSPRHYTRVITSSVRQHPFFNQEYLPHIG